MVFDVKGMSKSIPMEALKDLIFVLLSKLLDESAHRALEDNPDILKAVNILMLKMISNNFGSGPSTPYSVYAPAQPLPHLQHRSQQLNLEILQKPYKSLISNFEPKGGCIPH